MKILLEEEYGYRYWIWDTGKNKEEVLSWWSELETVRPFFFNPSKTLPFGEVLSLNKDWVHVPETEAYMHLHEDEDSFLRVDEELFLHKGSSKH